MEGAVVAVKAPVESLGGSITMETAFKHQLQLIWAHKKKKKQNRTPLTPLHISEWRRVV